MTYRNLPVVIKERSDAEALLTAIAAGLPESELAPFVTAMTTPAEEHGFAVMRGSGNEMSLPLQLISLLAGTGLISQDDAVAAIQARHQAERRTDA